MKANIPIKFLKLEDGFRLLITIHVNGKKVNVLIDTGASKTVFDISRSAKFVSKKFFEKHDQLSTGLGTSTMKSKLVIIESIKLGKINVRNYKTVVIDLAHVNVAYAQLKVKPIDGVLGSDLLKQYNAVIDYDKKELRLEASR